MIKEQISQMLGALCRKVRTKRVPLRKKFALNTSERQHASVVPPYLGGQKHEKQSKNYVQILLYQGNTHLLISFN